MSLIPFPEDYPDNYDYLSEEQQKGILDYLNKIYDQFLSYISDKPEVAHEVYLQLYSAEEVLKRIGIKVEVDWIGHREEYFLATRMDAERQEEFLFSVAEDG